MLLGRNQRAPRARARVPSQTTCQRLLAQHARQRQRRKHVAAGAARHDEDRAAHARAHARTLAAARAALPRIGLVIDAQQRCPSQASVTIRLQRP